MKAYNHAFTIAFSVETLDEEGNVKPEALEVALLRRIRELEGDELIEATGCPFDTYEFEVDVYFLDEDSDYLVVINQSVYEMSYNADQPNGVNMYIGELSEWENSLLGWKKLPDEQVPKAVVKAIESRLLF